MDTTQRRKRRRASFGYDVILQAKVRPETRDKVQKLADIIECSEAQVIREAIEAYDLDKRILTAQGTAQKRRQREAAKAKEVAV